MVVKEIKTVEQIKNGDFKVPPIKKVVISNKENNNAGFEVVEDLSGDLPF